MFDEFKLTVPANTAAASPVSTRMRLSSGVLHFVELVFPPGCKHMVHVRIERGGKTLFPRTRANSIVGDTFPIRWFDWIELKPGDNELTFLGWSPDTQRQHQLVCRLAWLRREELAPETTLGDLLRQFFKLFRLRETASA